MPAVIVVLFWIWLIVALGVYGYRIYRRATQGPKGQRAARAADGSGPAPAGGNVLSRLAKGPVAPLPEGPVEARLPRSLQDRAPVVGADGQVVIPAAGPAQAAHSVGQRDEDGDAGGPAPVVPTPLTLAEALEGIRMPADLLPIVQPAELGLVDGRRARFGATGTNVATVAVALGEELQRLGYLVDGLATVSSTRAGLTAIRGTVAVAATVEIDDDTGAVVVQLSV